MAQFQIFSGVAVPAAKRGAGFGPRESKYPFDQMDVGDAMLVENKSTKDFGGTARAAEKKHNISLVIRSGPLTSAELGGAEGDKVVVPANALVVIRVASKPERKYTPMSPEARAAAVEKAKATRAANKAAKANVTAEAA